MIRSKTIEKLEQMIAWLIAMVLVITIFLSLTGCESLTYDRQRELAFQSQGCFCQAQGCETVRSASGKAALAAAGGRVVQITEIRQPKSPEGE